MAKNTLLVTAEPGRAVWPHVNEPDTKFETPGVYHTKVAYPTSSAYAQSLIKRIDDLIGAQAAKDVTDKKLKKAKTSPDLPYKVDEEKNEVVFNFKLKSEGKTKEGKVFTQRPMIYDAKGAKMAEKVGGGSLINVSFEPYTWYSPKDGTGVSLRLKAMQVIELREYTGASAESFGFQQQEGHETDGSEFHQAAAAATAASAPAASAPRTESPKSSDF